VDAAEREQILSRYVDHKRRFDAAARRAGSLGQQLPLPTPGDSQPPKASAREITVLQLIADGLTNRDISLQLVLSEETVKTHIRRLLAKLQAKSRAHAVAIGFQRRIIS
jgi:DNA-binding NarL/FixJ family response regulator